MNASKLLGVFRFFILASHAAFAFTFTSNITRYGTKNSASKRNDINVHL